RLLDDRAVVAVQNPVRLGLHSEPQPDVAVLRPRADLYTKSHPVPNDVFLIVEVADTSATVDRQVKLPLYARAGIPEVWLLIVGTSRSAGLEVYREPGEDGYQVVQRLRRGDTIAPQAFPDLAIRVTDLLGA